MHSVPYAKETLVMLLGYALGCFTSGYYLVRWRTGDDIRWLGSGSVGATNVGRVLGRPGFFLTVLCDFFKGLFAVWLVGHIWPAQLWFHGGKGVATSLGALLMFDYSIALTYAALFLVVYTALRNFVLAGLLAFALTPLALFAADYSLTSVFGVSALALLVLIAHRKNIPDEIHKLMTGRKLKGDKRAVPRQP